MYNRLDTDRQTDGHLPRQSPRYAYAMRGKKTNSMIELVNKAYYSTVTELKFNVTVQDLDVAVVSSRMCPKITKDVAKKWRHTHMLVVTDGP